MDSSGEMLKSLTWMQQQNAKGCVLKVDLEHLLGLMKLHNNYPLAPDEIKI